MVTKYSSLGVALGLLASTAYGQTSFVGKKASVVSGSNIPVILPTFPATVTIASVLVPAKYKSKKNILAVSTSVQENCTGDTVSSVLTVGGFNAEPDPTASGWFECNNNGGFEMRAREWFLVPESAGGPVVPAGASIDLLLSSSSGTSQAAVAVIHAELDK